MQSKSRSKSSEGWLLGISQHIRQEFSDLSSFKLSNRVEYFDKLVVLVKLLVIILLLEIAAFNFLQLDKRRFAVSHAVQARKPVSLVSF